MGKIGKIAVVVTAVLAFIFIGACTGGNAWVKGKQCGSIFGRTICVDIEQGLWKGCSSGNCASYTIVPGYFKTVRAFTVLSTLAMIVSIVLAGVGLCKDDFKPLFASIFAFISALCALIGLAVFAAELKLGSAEYGWSFILGWIGMITAVVSGILGFLTEKC